MAMGFFRPIAAERHHCAGSGLSHFCEKGFRVRFRPASARSAIFRFQSLRWASTKRVRSAL